MDDVNLGRVVTNARARRLVYGGYVIAVVVVGALQAGFAAVGVTPEWLTVVLAVVAFLGVPVGSLAAVNTPRPGAAVMPGMVVPDPSVVAVSDGDAAAVGGSA